MKGRERNSDSIKLLLPVSILFSPHICIKTNISAGMRFVCLR